MIPHPIDLQTIRTELQNNAYRSGREFAAAVELVWTNAIRFNGEESYYSSLAREGQAKFRRSFAKVCKTHEEEWLRKLIKTAQLLKEKAMRLSKLVAREAKKEAERITSEV